jgi:hypothetical protein
MNGLASSTQVTELHARLDGMENRFNARLSDITRFGIGIALLLSVAGLIVAGVTQ